MSRLGLTFVTIIIWGTIGLIFTAFHIIGGWFEVLNPNATLLQLWAIVSIYFLVTELGMVTLVKGLIDL